MGWHGHACFDDLVNFSIADSFDLQEIFPGRVNNRFNSAETRIFKLLNINGSNARRLELKIQKPILTTSKIENFRTEIRTTPWVSQNKIWI
jgi:hypothetical protein